MRQLTPGGKAWIGLTLYVIAYDSYAVLTQKDTMSTAFLNAIKHPKKRWPVIAAWIYITTHLFKLIPEKIDPLRALPALKKT
jgi:hypothetical protein